MKMTDVMLVKNDWQQRWILGLQTAMQFHISSCTSS